MHAIRHGAKYDDAGPRPTALQTATWWPATLQTAILKQLAKCTTLVQHLPHYTAIRHVFKLKLPLATFATCPLGIPERTATARDSDIPGIIY